MAEETITITKKEYNQLVDNSRFLTCLEACGVDNWIGFDDAHDMMEEQYPND